MVEDCENPASCLHHYNGLMHLVFGSGVGKKGPGYLALLVCEDCHLGFHLEQSKHDHYFSLMQFFAMVRTWEYWVDLGLIQFPKDSWK